MIRRLAAVPEPTIPTMAEAVRRYQQAMQTTLLAFSDVVLAMQAEMEELRQEPEDTLLKASEVAARLKCDTSTVYRMWDDGRLAYVMIGGTKRTLASELTRLRNGKEGR